ncbi:MAG: hypothetical protein EKK53_24680 [Burkholderiales bacterium]|nr:MAG: hypothetical protein EKK53_24680 [Burkholderiales bacterium]
MKARNPIVIHYVHDMERAKLFYTAVFGVSPAFESPDWTTLDFDAVQVDLAPEKRSSWLMMESETGATR